jgi:hypothetical protein
MLSARRARSTEASLNQFENHAKLWGTTAGRISLWGARDLAFGGNELTAKSIHNLGECTTARGRRENPQELLMNQTRATWARPPLTAVGVASYAGLLAYEVSVTGTLPQGETTRDVTYFIVDSTNTVVGHVVLPDAAPKFNSISMTVKVPNASTSLAIGTFEADGFHPTTFLRVDTGNNRGPRGA